MNTSYVPLEHPYQIIEYQGVLGIQIGTLVVTVDKTSIDGEYAIETHSHPVVSYVNNSIHSKQKKTSTISMLKPYEGVVWDKVELHQVHSLIREDEDMSWQEFMDYCCKLRLFAQNNPRIDPEIAIFDSYGQLKDWGIEITPPKWTRNKGVVLDVEIDGNIVVNGMSYLVTRGDLGIVVGMIDENAAVNNTIRQVLYYIGFMNHFGIDVDKVQFWTQNLFMTEITEALRKHEDFINKKIEARNYGEEEDEDGSVLMVAESDEP